MYAYSISLLIITTYSHGTFGKQQLVVPRILGGDKVPIQEAPYQVAIFLNNHLKCGGSLITPTTVLTAAHCTINGTASNYTVRAGSSFFDSGGLLLQVSKVISHNYNIDDFMHKNDIALMILSQPAIGDNIASIELTKEEPQQGTKAAITGWGLTSDRMDATVSRHLLRALVPIITKEECKEAYLWEEDNNVVCAYWEDGRADACQGDSGGPLVVAGKLAGVSSFGFGCGLIGFPGVYTSVAKYTEWIEQHLTNKQH